MGNLACIAVLGSRDGKGLSQGLLGGIDHAVFGTTVDFGIAPTGNRGCTADEATRTHPQVSQMGSHLTRKPPPSREGETSPFPVLCVLESASDTCRKDFQEMFANGDASGSVAGITFPRIPGTGKPLMSWRRDICRRTPARANSPGTSSERSYRPGRRSLLVDTSTWSASRVSVGQPPQGREVANPRHGHDQPPERRMVRF